MTRAYWSQVKAGGLAVPDDRPLTELTTELTTMLGSPDPHVRDGLAYPTLATWVDRGVYDDLLTGLGDGMAAGLTVGLGEQGTDSVFRRAFSVLVLAECIDRDNHEGLLPAGKLLEWGDRIATWYLRERDLRGFVRRQGLGPHGRPRRRRHRGARRGRPHLGRNELTVLLDVHRRPAAGARRRRLAHGEPDRMALATMTVLRRNVVPITVVEPWVARIAAGAAARVRRRDRPVRRDGQRPGVPAGAATSSWPSRRHRPTSARPAAGAGLGAAHDQPVVPVADATRSVTCGHDR